MALISSDHPMSPLKTLISLTGTTASRSRLAVHTSMLKTLVVQTLMDYQSEALERIILIL
jgi:hypothetical protein